MMPEPLSPPITPRARPRVPSGPRPLRDSQVSFRSSSSSSVPQAGSSRPDLHNQPSLSSLAKLHELSDSPLDALIDTEHDYTLSPESSPKLNGHGSPGSNDHSPPISSTRIGSPVRSPTRAGTFAMLQGKIHDATHRSHTAPMRPSTPNSFSVVSRPTTPIQSPPAKVRPKPSKLNTLNLAAPMTSPSKPLSPGLKHWQQVRSHVMAPTPQDEKPGKAKKMNIVTKTAGRFGFRQAAENVMGFEERRRSTMGFVPDFGGLTAEEQEEIARERRKFARDVKACLDACAMEESQRRLQRVGSSIRDQQPLHRDPKGATSVHKHGVPSVHGSSHMPAQKYTFDPNFSSFAPLLTELHRHLPAARAKKLWCRTCPHHAAILAELGVSFLSDGTSTDGERQQALEVFGVVVRNWASDSADEELDRWLWLCRALLTPDRQLRRRGLALLTSFLHADPALPAGHDRPHSANAFQSLAIALLTLYQSLSNGGYGFEDHLEQVKDLIHQLGDGELIDTDQMTLDEILGQEALQMMEGSSGGGLEKDLLWMAVGRAIGQNKRLATWLLENDGEMLLRFVPPPLLHATPPLVLRLRSLSTAIHLTSLSNLVQPDADAALIRQAWLVAERLLIPDIPHLLDADNVVMVRLSNLLLHLELARANQETAADSIEIDPADPFRISSKSVQDWITTEHQQVMAELLKQEQGKKGVEESARVMVSTGSIPHLSPMIKSLLQSKPFAALGKECVNTLFTRFASTPDSSPSVQSLLAYLQASHPQLLYRPLFSLSASTNATTLLTHLRVVRATSSILGPTKFWTTADPQMVVITLMGDITPRQSKGKGKEGETAKVTVKLGRYAVLMELLVGLDSVGHEKGKARNLKSFVEAIEAKLGIMLETEEKEGTLPHWYRALMCRLFFRFRSITLSIKRTSWQRLVISWYQSSTLDKVKDDTIAQVVRSTYVRLSASSKESKSDVTKPHKSLQSETREKRNCYVDDLSGLDVAEAASSLLVAIYSCLAPEDWQTLLPLLWSKCGQVDKNSKAIVFLFMKCGEIIPQQVFDLVLSDLYSPVVVTRTSALRRLANLYGWRHQVLSQLILTDRRGPIFHFSARTLEFVATEIGSPSWVPPHDVQDAALQKFGTTLSLELRQRLMELGWSEDQSIAGKSDWEQIPLSKLPALQYLDGADQSSGGGGGGGIHSTPTRSQSLMRRGSSGSGSSFHGKRRKAVFAPILLSIINEQASILAHDPDSLVGTTSRDLVRLLQRDDAAAFLRPFTDGLSVDFTQALARLNAVVTMCTPSFAYSALNALVGYLKTVLRTDPSFGIYAPALATIAYLVPHVSEISLRDIRKNKAEHVLLPASIHEEEGGFKVHAPWRDGSLDVQTAQLLILNEILKANPREVYLVKKMLSNLQIQGSTSHLPFARAWLVLIASLFSTVNRNYNDRAELRHFLSNVATIFRLHGVRDQLIASHSMRVFILCSARFRRLFASMGFSTVMRSIYEVYALAGTNAALRDCIEYSARSFYRIHQDAFVYQACVVISEGEFDPKAAYDLLVCLSSSNSASAGVASGLRGMNDKEELEALVQMISGPELSLSEIGTGAAERAASKMSSINLNDSVFPKENIVKLFVTVVAALPTTKRAADFLRLLSGMVPFVKDQTSSALLREGIEALGSVILKGKTGDEAAITMFHPGTNDSKSDWSTARREYVFLVESYARSGGQLAPAAMKRTLEMVYELLRKQPEAVGPAAASILRQLAQTHLSASGQRPYIFLRDIAPLFKMFISVVDFSGLLDEITALIRKSGYELDRETTDVIIDSYVSPSVQMLASMAEDNMAFIVPIRSSIVELLACAVFLQGDALAALERCPPNHNWLAALVIPLCFSAEQPTEVDRETIYDALWTRILHYVIKPPSRPRGPRQVKPVPPAAMAATTVLSLQIIKLACIKAYSGIAKVTGLWHYISRYLITLIDGGNAKFLDGNGPDQAISPRILDWMLWSIFELLSLHHLPLMIDMRHLIQIQLAASQRDDIGSRPSTPGEGHAQRPRMPSSPHLGGRARMPSARTPSVAFLRSFPGNSPSPEPQAQGQGHTRNPSSSRLTPDSTPFAKGHGRMPSQHLTPYLGGHGRMPSGSFSGSGAAGGLSVSRPSFADLSARRASRPAFAVPGGGTMNYRFPSSQPVRSLNPDKGGGAIIHLLGAPNNVLSATSAGIPSFDPRPAGTGTGKDAEFGDSGKRAAVKQLNINSEVLKANTRRALRSCRIVFGYPDEEAQQGEEEDEEDNVRMWSDHDAIQAISEQTRLFVEEEFRDIFAPAQDDWVSLRGSRIESDMEGYSSTQLDNAYDDHENDSKEWIDDKAEMTLPKLEISSPTRD